MATASRRVIMAVIMAAYLPGCTGWHDRVTRAPTPVSDRPEFLRITLQNGHRVELHDARIEGDSVIGQSDDGSSRVRTPVALHDVNRIADRQTGAWVAAGAFT